jgi:6-phosphogluconolactonase (cycloisomerase 2 family)
VIAKQIRMKLRTSQLRMAAIAAMLACLALSGCSSGSSSNSSHLAYVATSSGIFAYRISNTGVPTTVFSAPFMLGRSPSSILIAPSGLGYVADSLDNTISRVQIDSSSGALSEVLPRTTIAGSAPSAMVMDSGGGFLYVANQGSNDVESYSVGSDGTLTFASSATVGSSPSGLVLSSSGNLLFVTVPNFSSIYAFTVSSGTLTPIAGSPFHVANGVASVAINPSATFLYAPDFAANTVSGFSILPGGVLSALQKSPYGNTTTPLKNPVASVVDPTGKFLYVANFTSTTISIFDISSTGDLTPKSGTSGSAGTNPFFFTIDTSGKYMYVGNEGSKSITEFTLNSDGTLTSTNTIQVGAVPRSIAFTK